MRKLWLVACAWLLLLALPVLAERQENYLNLSTRVALDPLYADLYSDWDILSNAQVYKDWQADKSATLLHLVSRASPLRSQQTREDLLGMVYYESHRIGINPDWVLAVMQVESGFRKYAISNVGARGFMQVMPFWVELIGEKHHNLFNLRTNLRYGTVILRHYIDIEEGHLFRALGRYNGSLGRVEYPNLVLRAYEKNWQPRS